MNRALRRWGSVLALSLSVCINTEAQTLPDTCYRSADALVVAVDHIDSLTDPTINGSKNLYRGSNILTFRGSAQRDMPQSGRLLNAPDSIVQVWCYQTGTDLRTTQYGTWYGGAGWTGQPLYIEWSDSLLSYQQQQRNTSQPIPRREIIIGSLSGELCFIDFETGKASRPSYNVGNPIKGTISLDPRMNGYLYVGHGVPNEAPFGALVFDLFHHRIISLFDRDPKAWRGWGAYDSSAVVAGNFVIRPSENGTLYKWVAETNRMRLHTAMRYRTKGNHRAAGMEASAALYGNYCYTLDNHGNLVCTNLDTMLPVWHFSNGDDSDASPVLLVEGGIPMLYVGSALDKQGDKGYCHFTKLDARNGNVVWQQRIPCHKLDLYGKLREGGMFSTPLVGHGNCEGLLFTNLCGLESGERGALVAIDRQTGQIRYRTKLNNYSWSSPVALYTPDGALYIFTGDVSGYGYLIEGITGKIRCVKRLGTNFEASPIAVGDRIVIASRGREIYQFKIQ